MTDMPARALALCSLLPLAAYSCSGETGRGPTKTARPVTVAPIVAQPKDAAKRLSGIVKPQREEDVAFEVSGRLEFVVEVGDEFRGPKLDAGGEVVEKGEVIARIETTRYEQAFEAARLRLASALLGQKAQELEIEQVSKAEIEQAAAKAAAARESLRSAETQERLAKATLTRTRGLVASETASKQRLDEDQAAYDNAFAALRGARSDVEAADAAVATSKARGQLLLANLERTKAEIRELEQSKVQAQQDLIDCVLRAPFSGRITDKLAGRGGYVRAGTPVVTLTMMDPVKVSVMVTAAGSRKLLPGTPARLFPSDLSRFTQEDTLVGHVFAKAEVADAATRTYLVDLIVRNVQRRRFLHGKGGEKVFAVDRIMPVLRKSRGDGGPLFVPTQCIDPGRAFVLRLPGVRMGNATTPVYTSKILPEKIAVSLEQDFFTIASWSFQQVAGETELEEGDLLIADPKDEHLTGVAVARDDWALRPGDIVPVSFRTAAARAGLWVSRDAIRSRNGETAVFAVGADNRVREVAVELREEAGVLQRIEGADLAPGTRLVMGGLHYVADGDEVTVVPQLGK